MNIAYLCDIMRYKKYLEWDKPEGTAMKKVIFGTGLLICGVLGILTYLIIEAIYFASPNHIAAGNMSAFVFFSVVFMVIGIVLSVFGFLERDRVN